MKEGAAVSARGAVCRYVEWRKASIQMARTNMSRQIIVEWVMVAAMWQGLADMLSGEVKGEW